MGFFDMIGGAFGGDRDQQQALLQQLQGVAAGTGPNPAKALLNQQTQLNNAMAGGQIANAQGMSPALAARQIMETQRQNQQQAAGQGATMQAQQSYNALGQEGTLLNQQRQADTGESNAIVGGAMKGLSSAAGLGGMYRGGRVPGYADGGGVSGDNWGFSTLANGIASLGGKGPSGGIGSLLGGSSDSSGSLGDGGSGLSKGLASFGGALAAAFSRGGAVSNYTAGGSVPGRARVAGNSPHNDTVNAKLSPGEVVLPRSVTMAKNAPAQAAAFMRAITMHGMRPGKSHFDDGGKVPARTPAARVPPTTNSSGDTVAGANYKSNERVIDSEEAEHDPRYNPQLSKDLDEALDHGGGSYPENPGRGPAGVRAYSDGGKVDPKRAASFVRAVQKHHFAQGGTAEGPPSYGAVIAKQKEHEKRLKALESGKRKKVA